MRLRVTGILFLLAVVAVALPGAGQTITSLNPSAGPIGMPITLLGSGFGLQDVKTVRFNGVTASIVSWSDTAITATVPSGLVLGDVTVLIQLQRGFGTSNSVTFTVTPGVSQISPSIAPVQTPLTVTGTSFGASQGSSAISIGGVNATPTVWSDTSITVPLPAGVPAGSANLIVTVNGISSPPVTVLVIPVISAASPATAAVGGSVTVTGTSFGDTQGSSTVTFNGIPAIPSAWSNTSITFPIPVGASSGAIIVTVNGVESNGDPYLVSPAITSLSPVSGPVGGTLTINGSGFGAAQNFNPVTIGGVSVTPSFWSDTSIQVPVDSSLPAGTVSVVVTVNTIASNAASFLVTPSITALSANSGLVGDSITIAGTSFGGTQGASSVSFNGLAAIPSVWTNTSITVPVPTGASTGPVLVTVNGASSNLVGFTVLVPPSITSLSANSGFPGTRITITGSNFGATQGSGTVQIGGQPMIVSAWSDSSIDVVVPAEALTGDIVVTSAVGIASNPVTFTVNFGGPVLQVAVSDAPLQVNLTSPQTLDWVHWGRISETLPDRKNGISPLISDYTLINSTQAQVFPENIAFSWTDGNHPPVVSETFADVETYDPGSGFQITVPADTTVKTLNLYAEVFSGQAILHASLSDGSAVDITDQSVTDSDIGSKVYSIDFRAASPGQTLTVTFTGALTAGGVGLQAATLTPHLPVVNITSPFAAQSYPAGSSIPLTVAASQLDSSIFALAALATDGSSFTSASAPLSANWQPAASGHYLINANALDTTGLTNTALPAEVDVIGQGGSLAIQENVPAATVDLDSEGSADWILWGLLNTGDSIVDNSGHVVARKSGVAPLISGYKPIGNHFILPQTFAHDLCFTGDQQSYCGSQATVHGLGNGFEINVAADTTLRTLQVYVGFLSADASVTAFLSDGSAPVATEIGGSGPPASNTTLYTINYSAASSGQTLTVRLTLNTDQGGGQISLIGAALNGSPVVPIVPTPQIASLDPTSAAINTRITITGSNFGATQGDGLVFIGGVDAQIVTWSDASIVAIVPSGLTGGRSVDVQVISDSGISNVASLNILSYKVQPQDLNMAVGDSRTLLVTDLSGNPLSGIGWATSDSTIVTLSTDDPPVITAVGVGSAKVWAGDIPVSVTVFAPGSLPVGTPLWTLPVGSGSGNISLVPAVPSDSGADVFALDDSGTLTAISSDGFPVWKVSSIPGGSSAKIIPDFAGNALLKTPFTFTDAQGHLHSTHKIQKADQTTGQMTDLFTYADQQSGTGSFDDSRSLQAAIPDPTGKLFIGDNAAVTIIDPAGVQPTVNIALDNSTVNGVTQPPTVGQMIVAGDGNSYTPYVYVEETDSTTGSTTTSHSLTHLMLFRASPDGTSAKIELKNWSFDSTCVPWTPPNGPPNSGTQCNTSGPSPSVTNLSVITNADQGAAVFTTAVLTACSTEFFSSPGIVDHETGCGDTLAHTELDYVSQDVVTSQIPDAVVLPNDDGRLQAFVPALQREDGSYIGTDTTSEIFGWSNLIAVSSAGSVLWKQAVTSTPTYITPQYATATGGIIVQSRQVQNCQSNPPQCQTVGPVNDYTLDQTGTVVGHTQDIGTALSWTGNSYTGSAFITRVALSITPSEASFAAVGDGNASRNGAAIAGCPCLFQTSDEQPLASLEFDLSNITDSISALGLFASSAPPVLPPPLVCPICDLPHPEPPSCVISPGTQSTFLLLVGDAGLNTNGNQHNTGLLFSLAAQTRANQLQSEGHRVIACRISSIQDFESELAHNGLIDGGVVYFGHSGLRGFAVNAAGQLTDVSSEIFIGELSGADTNIATNNSAVLDDVRTALCPDKNNPACNAIGQHAAVEISGCDAGMTILDHYAQRYTSIAHEISVHLQRGTYAYDVGLYFSHLDADHDAFFDGHDPRTGNARTVTATLPIYMVPEGAPGKKPKIAQR